MTKLGIKWIYISTLVYKAKISWIENDKYGLTWFFNNGRKSLYTEYKNDIYHGISLAWDPNGNVINTQIWYDGKIIK